MNNLATEEYFYGAGESAFIELDATTGLATGKMLFVGDAESAKISLKVDRKEKRESRTGRNMLVRSKITQFGGELTITLNEAQKENLAMFLFGSVTVIAPATAHTDTIPGTTVAVGEIYALDFPKVSNVVVKDGAAATVDAAKYEVDATYGKLKVITSWGTGPFVVTYDYATHKQIGIFQHSGKVYRYRHEGVNVGNSADIPYILEGYRIQPDPVSDLELITNDFGKFELKGQLLLDTTKPNTGPLGQFGRYLDLR